MNPDELSILASSTSTTLDISKHANEKVNSDVSDLKKQLRIFINKNNDAWKTIDFDEKGIGYKLNCSEKYHKFVKASSNCCPLTCNFC